MTSVSKTTGIASSNHIFWINDDGKSLLIKSLNKREIIELFQIVIANIKTIETMFNEPLH